MDLLDPGKKTDAAILEGIKICSLNIDRGSANSEIIAFNGALALTDPDLRIGSVRAVFRRILTKDAEAAREMLAYPDFPAEIKSALREIASQNGL